MAKSSRRKQNLQPDEPEFLEGEGPPPKGTAGWTWAQVLTPLLDHPGRWARIRTFDTATQAAAAQSNLHSRTIKVPDPEQEWAFAARGCDVYAIYNPNYYQETKARRGRTQGGSIRRGRRTRKTR